MSPSALREPAPEAAALACDCHAHILGPQANFPYVDGRSFTPPDALPAAYSAMLARLGLARMVIVQPSVYGSDNRRLLSAVAELGPRRARGVCMIDLDTPRDELERLHAGGVRAIRYIATAGGGPALADLPRAAALIADLGWHIESYVPPALLPQLIEFAGDLPVPIVFDHMGGLPANTAPGNPALAAILTLLESGRAWVKLIGYRNSLAGPPYRDVAPLARLFAARAPDRCVWGSDWPHTNVTDPPDDLALLHVFEEWVPDTALRRRILVDNPAALYGFGVEQETGIAGG